MLNLRDSAPAILAVLLSGTLSFLSAGIHHVWIAAWFAPLPLLVLLLNARFAISASAAFAAPAIGATSFVVAYSGFPPALRASMILILAVPFTLVALAWRTIALRSSPVVAVVAYPALVTSAEYVLSLVSPNGTFGSIAYSQADLPVVLQVASLTGIWGIAFLLSLVPAGLAIAWHHRAERKTAATALSLGFLPLVLALLFGAVRLAGPASTDRVRVGLAVSDVGAGRNFALREPAEALAVVRAYADRAAALAKDGARVVVLPEKLVGVTPEYADGAHALFRDAARTGNATIVAGFNLLGPPERRNVAVVFGPDGNVAIEYDKQHLVPGFEGGYRRGQTIGTISGTAPAIGVAICKDLDFVPLGREYARAGVGLLLVPAWDFVNDGWLHSRMAVLRGVEGGYAVARVATEGLLTVSDARGRMLAERSSSESAEVLLTASAPIAPGGTFYSRSGDWFAWVSMGAVAASIACGWRNGRATPG